MPKFDNNPFTLKDNQQEAALFRRRATVAAGFVLLMFVVLACRYYYLQVIEYDTYSRYPGGRHLYSYKTMNQLHPERVIQLAVKRMLPKNKLATKMLARLKIFSGTEHPHQAQSPEARELGN